MSLRNEFSANFDDVLQENAHERKKRRVQRACDMCRLKRVRCEGGQLSHRACTHCISNRYDCTYTQSHKKPNPDKVYIQSLETRLAKLENVLRKLVPDNGSLPDELAGDSDLCELSTFVQGPLVEGKGHQPAPSQASTSTPVLVDADDLDPSDDEYSARQTLEECFRRVSLDPGKPHFFGKSSSFMFLQQAMDIRQGYVNTTSNSKSRQSGSMHLPFFGPRAEFWKPHPCAQTKESRRFSFPPDDLMTSLIEIFFNEINVYSPLLHRPTFDKAVREGLHIRDDSFGSIVLLVCAIGARSSDDPRVFLDGSDSHHSAGWKWFRQAQQAFQVISFEPPRLYDLQTVCLFSLFIHGSSSPQASWPLIGLGLRLAQAQGAHRRKAYDSGPTVEKELMKRAFWVLVMMDRSISSAFGRPCGIQDEDFDVDLPTECDDEYWINPDPKLAFKQPPGKPSKISFFNCRIHLNQIHAYALRTIYSINKSKANLGHVGPEWEERTVAELDSALNSFIDSIPEHLRWNPHQDNMLFFNQSALLHAQYYGMQMTVHRSFIPSPRKPSRSSFPSLAICTNAARTCIRVVDMQFQRVQRTSRQDKYCQTIMPVASLFDSGMVLLLSIWGGKRSGASVDHTKEMSEVHKAMRMLKELDQRCFAAGRLWDILYEMASVGELPLPPLEQPISARKRSRGEDSDHPSMVHVHHTHVPDDPLAYTSGGGDVPQELQMPTSASAFSPFAFSLPISSQELGRLPSQLLSDTPGPSSLSNTVHIPDSVNALGTSFTPMYDRASTVGLAASGKNPYLPATHSSPENEANIVSLSAGPGVSSSSFSADDALEMWSSAPVGFEWEDWGRYIMNLNGPSDMEMSSTQF